MNDEREVSDESGTHTTESVLIRSDGIDTEGTAGVDETTSRTTEATKMQSDQIDDDAAPLTEAPVTTEADKMQSDGLA